MLATVGSAASRLAIGLAVPDGTLCHRNEPASEAGKAEDKLDCHQDQRKHDRM
jgi:hypothetical protein